MTAEDVHRHQQATECFICGWATFAQPKSSYWKVHMSRKQRVQPGIQVSNIQQKEPILHSPCCISKPLRLWWTSSNELNRQVQETKITCIASNSERYITFWFGGLRFIHSLQFMNASCERLVESLTRDELKFLHKLITGPKQHELLFQKGVYPYDYVDGPAKLEKTQLPPTQEL